ncbi:glycogen debranching enzyme GlgX [Xaviernesmea oryzae]|uniref:Glycogen debranching enzyme GlgX n=1 Tax=Xaviernesmea oryzae TaxID=464029 RepID=A0A1Q9AZ87_9HYPH|nr:glycogen debranching protein GlgX [Xaviernesmea oryzae]OLP61017.1 glycogen debranching enzyme GlgX [Xaviernesmea oryzae]SEL17096.1 glycogen operon protein [Xaviernesmea oryzae]
MTDSPLGASFHVDGTEFSVASRHAAQVDLCLFPKTGGETRLPMQRGPDHVWRVKAQAPAGTAYGFRADGIYAPDRGLWFDPAKLLVDPYAVILDRPFRYDPALGVQGVDTSDLVPRALVTDLPELPLTPAHWSKGGLVYEVAVRPFTKLHPDIPEAQRGTVAALAHPAIIAHLKALGVAAVELMPITAWVDEQHLGPLGLTNGWGYNPVAMMALDPRLVPGGVTELRETVATLHAEGIGVILDLVFNHSGESDRFGPTLSMRGLDNLTYYRHAPDLTLINDTGCGNTIDCAHPVVERLILDTLRHFVRHAGIDGFRFDLGSILGRDAWGFRREAPLFKAMAADPWLAGRLMIAEPWDIGPGGYQLGHFPADFLEWNDRARDDIRCFWRGDGGKVGALAAALSGSSALFAHHGEEATRSVTFIAAHDGFTLADLVAYRGKHNQANGEDNRDGHNENHSWNNGAEGETSDAAILAARRRDLMALLSTLFASRGAIMLAAGDEFGRSQKGNNNAYAQDNAITWVDWQAADPVLLAHAQALAALRARFGVFQDTAFLTGQGDVAWLRLDGATMTVSDWDNPQSDSLVMVLSTTDGKTGAPTRLAIAVHRGDAPAPLRLPGRWLDALASNEPAPDIIAPRSIAFLIEAA